MKSKEWEEALEKAKAGTTDEKLNTILEVLFGFISGIDSELEKDD